ncbi:hypothetical protein [Maricaulis sp.]|uniref:hypothetical protein n=1 Tax=Maricaulis sp. TaxID=1486257 RepID=UPI003297A5FC
MDEIEVVPTEQLFVAPSVLEERLQPLGVISGGVLFRKAAGDIPQVLNLIGDLKAWLALGIATYATSFIAKIAQQNADTLLKALRETQTPNDPDPIISIVDALAAARTAEPLDFTPIIEVQTGKNIEIRLILETHSDIETAIAISKFFDSIEKISEDIKSSLENNSENSAYAVAKLQNDEVLSVEWLVGADVHEKRSY